MVFPFLQFIYGIGVGAIGLLMIQPKPITYDTQVLKKEKIHKHQSIKFQTKTGELCVICTNRIYDGNRCEYTCGLAVHKTCYEMLPQNQKACLITYDTYEVRKKEKIHKHQSKKYQTKTEELCIICNKSRIDENNRWEYTCGHAIHNTCYEKLPQNQKACTLC